VISYTCKYWNISAVFIEIFQHNQQYDTLLSLTPCVHQLKAGIANWATKKYLRFQPLTHGWDKNNPQTIYIDIIDIYSMIVMYAFVVW
jgi:hypothetical protein